MKRRVAKQETGTSKSQFIEQKREEKVMKERKVVATLTNDLRGVFCMMYLYCVCHSPILVGEGKEKREGGQDTG